MYSRNRYAENAGRLTLVFSVTTLDLLMNPFLHFSLEDARPSRLVEVGNFQNVGRVNPVIGATAHNMVSIDVKLVYRHLVRTVSHSVKTEVGKWGQADSFWRKAIGARGRSSTHIAVCCRVYPAVHRHGSWVQQGP